MKIVIEEVSTNIFVHYDMEGLRNFENRYEAMFIMHSALLESDKIQLELANEILNQIAREDE